MAGKTVPAVLQLLSTERLAGTAAQLLGGKPGQRVRLYQDSLFLKRSGDGPTHWHADLAMAPLDTNAFVTCWLPLQPVPAEGHGGTGLVFAGGSHRDVALPFWHGDPRECGDVSGRGYDEASCGALAVGDATWHHGWTLHCAPPNERHDARRALAASFFLDGATRLRQSGRTPDDEDLESHAEWLRAVQPGKPARHELLPVVWPPASVATSPAGGEARAAARKSRKPRARGGRSKPRGARGRGARPREPLV